MYVRLRAASLFDIDEMTPAAGQGIVALETSKSNARAVEACNAISHALSARAAQLYVLGGQYRVTERGIEG